MPWKMEGEHHAHEGGNPIWVYDDGKEAPVDFPKALETIKDRNAESKTLREAKEALEKERKTFEVFLDAEGKALDPAEVRKAVETHKLLSEKKLLEAGEVQKIKDDAVSTATRGYAKEIEARDSEIANLKKAIEDKDKGWAFTTSKFVTERLTYPPAHALDVFGKHFKPENGTGKLVGYYNGEIITSRKTIGQPAEFDEAMEYIVEKDPFREKYLISDAGGGSGARHSPDRKTETIDPKLPPTDRLAAAWGAKPS